MLMLKTVTVLEAISKRRRTARPAAHTGLSKNTIFAATHSAEDALVLLDATANGLTAEHAAERLDAAGPNTIEAPTKTLARRIADAFVDPFAGILAALALVSLYIDVLAVPEPQRDPSTVIVIGIMLLVSGGMKFIQEARSGNAAEALKDLVSNTCTALRDGERVEIPFDELVPGDVIRLSAGDMVPADARIITARDLFVIESALTGESEAVEKTTAITVVESADGSALPLSACKNIVFTGTSVQNGTAIALVVATGSDTYLGGIAKMLNFAHGDVIMVGAYVSFCATSYLGLPGWASVVLSCVACTVLGVLIEGLAYKPLRQAGPLAVLITAIGVSYFLQNAAQLLWGATPKNFTSLVTFPVPEFLAKFNVSAVSLVTIVACLVIMAGLMFFTGKTKMGKAMRAVSEDKAAAQLMGINVNRTISMTFAIGSALAAIAGVLLCSYSPVLQPTTGAMPGIKAFDAAVFGGIGSIPGAFVGGILIGIIEAMAQAYISTSLANSIVFGVLIIVLLVKPAGLLGKYVPEKV